MKNSDSRLPSWQEILVAAALAVMVYLLLEDPGGVFRGIVDALF